MPNDLADASAYTFGITTSLVRRVEKRVGLSLRFNNLHAEIALESLGCVEIAMVHHDAKNAFGRDGGVTKSRET